MKNAGVGAAGLGDRYIGTSGDRDIRGRKFNPGVDSAKWGEWAGKRSPTSRVIAEIGKGKS
jgi:hypothetical protein